MRILLIAGFIFIINNNFTFEKVIIWGHKIHSHTHSYIHQSFFKTFKHLGYDTYWFDDSDDVSIFDFSNSLFVAEGQADKKLPIRSDCLYILHHCLHTSDRYRDLFNANKIIALEVYTDDILMRPNLVKMDECVYYDLKARVLYMPWATDLLPHEIDDIKRKMPFEKISHVYWIGTVGKGEWGNFDQVALFALACWNNNILFQPKTNIESEKHRELIQKSYMAPTIVGEWQQKNGYIPCRIFKNISYGQWGITNSERVYELFERKIVYNPDTHQLFYDAQQRLSTLSLDEMYELMDMIKNKHTYINRILVLLEFFDIIQKSELNK